MRITPLVRHYVNRSSSPVFCRGKRCRVLFCSAGWGQEAGRSRLRFRSFLQISPFLNLWIVAHWNTRSFLFVCTGSLSFRSSSRGLHAACSSASSQPLQPVSRPLEAACFLTRSFLKSNILSNQHGEKRGCPACFVGQKSSRQRKGDSSAVRKHFQVPWCFLKDACNLREFWLSQ